MYFYIKIYLFQLQVVTTSGPRKPHRQASNAFSTASNDLYRSNQDVHSYYNCSNTELHQTHHQLHHSSHNHMSSDSNGAYGSIESRPSLSQTNLQTSSNSSNLPLQRVCLETSFTNLHSPQMHHRNTHFPESVSSSKASSLAGSVLSRSQISCIQYDISSAMESSITTVARKSPIKCVMEEAKLEHNELVLHPPTTTKTKCVAFEDAAASPPGYLKRQHSAKIEKRPKPLAIPPLRRASDVTNGAVNDECWGLAPLASPETLSEISSISSRNSVRTSLTTSIDHYNNVPDINDVFESQLHTPTVLRRAPKFIENLSQCAEDKRNVDQYKRMGRVIVPPPLFAPTIQDSSEEEDSFESANSFRKVNSTANALGNRDRDTVLARETKPSSSSSSAIQGHRRQNSKSADQLDEVVASANKQQTETRAAHKLNFSDSNIVNDNGTITCDKICCSHCSDDNHSCNSNHFNSNTTGSQETTFYSANSSIDFITVTAAHKMNSICYTLPEGVLESHFPLHQDAFTNTNEFFTKHHVSYNNDRDQLTLGQKNTFSSPLGRGKRKNCIYPSLRSTQPLYAAPGDNVKLFTNTTTTTTTTNANNTTTTNIPELTIANGSSSPKPSSLSPNESSV